MRPADQRLEVIDAVEGRLGPDHARTARQLQMEAGDDREKARTRAARTTPSNEELFDGRRRDKVQERIAAAPNTALGLALKRAAA